MAQNYASKTVTKGALAAPAKPAKPSEDAIPIILVEPYGPSFLKLIERLEKDPSFQVFKADSPTSAVSTARQAGVCMILCHASVPEHVVKHVTMMKLLGSSVVNGTIRTLITTQFKQQDFIEKRLAHYGFSEMIPEPVNDKALAFKIDRHVRLLNKAKEQTFSSTARDTVTKQVEQSKESPVSRPTVKAVDALTLESDCWLSDKSQSRKIGDRWMIKMMGPGPLVWHWLPIASPLGKKAKDQGYKYWQWTPIDAANDQFSKEKGNWIFRGDRAPEFHENEWWFVDSDPMLAFFNEGQSLAQKLWTEKNTLFVAKDSPAALRAMESIQATYRKVIRKKFENGEGAQESDRTEEKNKNRKEANEQQTLAPAVVRMVPALTLQSDCWIIKRKGKRIGGRWTLTLYGPTPAEGKWIELDSTGHNEPISQWSPRDPEKDEFIKDEGAWVFEGNVPKFEEGAWVFAGQRPRLVFIKGTQLLATKVTLGPHADLLLAEDSAVGQRLLETIRRNMEKVYKFSHEETEESGFEVKGEEEKGRGIEDKRTDADFTTDFNDKRTQTSDSIKANGSSSVEASPLKKGGESEPSPEKTGVGEIQDKRTDESFETEFHDERTKKSNLIRAESEADRKAKAEEKKKALEARKAAELKETQAAAGRSQIRDKRTDENFETEFHDDRAKNSNLIRAESEADRKAKAEEKKKALEARKAAELKETQEAAGRSQIRDKRTDEDFQTDFNDKRAARSGLIRALKHNAEGIPEVCVDVNEFGAAGGRWECAQEASEGNFYLFMPVELLRGRLNPRRLQSYWLYHGKKQPSLAANKKEWVFEFCRPKIFQKFLALPESVQAFLLARIQYHERSASKEPEAVASPQAILQRQVTRPQVEPQTLARGQFLSRPETSAPVEKECVGNEFPVLGFGKSGGRWECVDPHRETQKSYVYLTRDLLDGRVQLLALPEYWTYEGDFNPNLSADKKQWIFKSGAPTSVTEFEALSLPVQEFLCRRLGLNPNEVMKKETGGEAESTLEESAKASTVEPVLPKPIQPDPTQTETKKAELIQTEQRTSEKLQSEKKPREPEHISTKPVKERSEQNDAVQSASIQPESLSPEPALVQTVQPQVAAEPASQLPVAIEEPASVVPDIQVQAPREYDSENEEFRLLLTTFGTEGGKWEIAANGPGCANWYVYLPAEFVNGQYADAEHFSKYWIYLGAKKPKLSMDRGAWIFRTRLPGSCSSFALLEKSIQEYLHGLVINGIRVTEDLIEEPLREPLVRPISTPGAAPSALVFGFLISELVQKKGFGLADISRRFCRSVSAACSGVKVELWSYTGESWVQAGTSIDPTEDRSDPLALREVAGRLELGAKFLDPCTLVATVRGRDGSKLGSLVFSGNGANLIPVEFASGASEMLVGLLTSLRQTSGSGTQQSSWVLSGAA